ncbi:hypothetical protein ACC693_38140, partial [Rhizobium ruizarguesonis]
NGLNDVEPILCHAILEQDHALFGVALAGRPDLPVNVCARPMNGFGPQDGLAIFRLRRFDEIGSTEFPGFQIGCAQTLTG